MRRTWLNSSPAAPAVQPAAISAMIPEERDAWRERMAAFLVDLRQNAATYLTEEEIRVLTVRHLLAEIGLAADQPITES